MLELLTAFLSTGPDISKCEIKLSKMHIKVNTESSTPTHRCSILSRSAPFLNTTTYECRRSLNHARKPSALATGPHTLKHINPWSLNFCCTKTMLMIYTFFPRPGHWATLTFEPIQHSHSRTILFMDLTAISLGSIIIRSDTEMRRTN